MSVADDHETIWPLRHMPSFSAIRLRVGGGPIEIRDLVVRYADGSAEVLPVNMLVGPNSHTEPIALSESRSGVHSIELWFGDLYGPQPYVTAYGLW